MYGTKKDPEQLQQSWKRKQSRRDQNDWFPEFPQRQLFCIKTWFESCSLDPMHFLFHQILRTRPFPCRAEQKTSQGPGERRPMWWTMSTCSRSHSMVVLRAEGKSSWRPVLFLSPNSALEHLHYSLAISHVMSVSVSCYRWPNLIFYLCLMIQYLVSFMSMPNLNSRLAPRTMP